MALIDDYQSDFNAKLLNHQHPAADAVKETAAWFTSCGRDLFIAAFEHETTLRIQPSLADAWIVESGFPSNVNDYITKVAREEYYRANAMMFLRATDEILTPAANGELDAAAEYCPELYWHNLRDILSPLLHDSVAVLEHWAGATQEASGVFGVFKNMWEEPLHLYHSALQCIYGNYSSFAMKDNQADTAINHLRVAVELRIRWGFGILARLDQNGGVAPIMLSRILDILSGFKTQIAFGVPLEHICRIYGWSNAYMHAGQKTYVWSTIVALRYLRPFILGGPYVTDLGTGTSVYAGIIVSQQIIKDVQQAAESAILGVGEKLIKRPPDKCQVVFRS